LGVLTEAGLAGFSHGLGDDRESMGAEMGVGSVETVVVEVAADFGVNILAESGVKGVLVFGESSVFADRRADSTGVLPDRRRLRDIW